MNLRTRTNNYLIINLIFTGLILILILYSFIFSAEGSKHPVPSAGGLTGQTLPSTGLSRSFSEIVRLEFDQARKYNPFGIRIFSFFFLQLLLRITGSFAVFYAGSEKLRFMVIADAVFSSILFILCFWPFFVSLVRQLMH
ncbi:MAG: hypothetical protein JW830_15675 [Bacteroidales bacterium]|nr:hypothetical protein [Bacteroidales bacterium]